MIKGWREFNALLTKTLRIDPGTISIDIVRLG